MANDKPTDKPNEKPNEKNKDEAGGGNEAGGKVPAATLAALAAEIEIEFGDDRNRVMLWGPTQEKLRGHWKRANLNADELVEGLVKMPDLPGQRIMLNAGRRMAVVYDPLALKENAADAERVAAVIYEFYRVKCGPAQAVEKKDMDADDIKTWLYLMRRHVDAKKARVTKGTLPTAAELEKLPGRSRVEYFNNSHRACKWREEFGEWLDKVLSLGR